MTGAATDEINSFQSSWGLTYNIESRCRIELAKILLNWMPQLRCSNCTTIGRLEVMVLGLGFGLRNLRYWESRTLSVFYGLRNCWHEESRTLYNLTLTEPLGRMDPFSYLVVFTFWSHCSDRHTDSFTGISCDVCDIAIRSVATTVYSTR